MGVEGLIKRTVLLVVGLALWGSASSPAVASFCDGSVVRDYEKPLRALPESNPLPDQLPFAPPTVSARLLGEAGERLVYRGGAPGILLRSEGSPQELNWTVRLVVSRLVADGAVFPVSETTTTFGVLPVNSLVPAHGAPLPELGSFRVESTFFNQSGALMGSYIDYVQVVPRTLDVRLGLTRRSVPAGGTLDMRLENYGTRKISFGYPYILERFDDHRWKQIPQGPFFAPLFWLQGGEAGPCQTIHIAGDAPAGKYRVRKDFGTLIRFINGRRLLAERQLSTTATFEVRAPRR